MTRLLDPIPLALGFVMFAIVSILFYEAGFRLGRWWQRRMPGEQEGPADMLVGSILALMAFLLAVTMGMASDRFDTRRGLVLAEANAIEGAFLQADYLPDPQADELKELLREYVPLRIAPSDPSQLPAMMAQGTELRARMWTVLASVARSGHSPDLMSALGDQLTELTNLNETRVVGGLYSRVPETVLAYLLLGSALSLGMVGYTAGLRERRSVLSAAVLIVVMGAVLMLVVDLDRPQDGLINVSQQALIDVQLRLGPPAP
ncbi:MAG TPA: hypothetical protein VFQ75_01070 [Candidatus Limnocylindrales bacterium]|jgi:hypothetical protein|nr:hypothetical protein [Candidatus Limnocylindrales bacterium]